jgi:hypothetical protein
MNIEREDADTVLIRARPHKAQDLLDGLLAHAEELGDLGRELAELLRQAGVEPSRKEEHIRHEYAPPRSH